MRLDAAQLDAYVTDGYLVVAAPWPRELTRRLQRAVVAAAASPVEVLAAANEGARSTQWRLLPQPSTGSGCNVLDQCLEFLQVRGTLRFCVLSGKSFPGESLLCIETEWAPIKRVVIRPRGPESGHAASRGG
jgi:hypothetical protein